MRFALLDPRALAGAFASGVAVGLTVSAVTAFLVGASRRARSPSRETRGMIIDGARPEDPAALSVRPAEEANSGPASVTSDNPVDVFLVHERW